MHMHFQLGWHVATTQLTPRRRHRRGRDFVEVMTVEIEVQLLCVRLQLFEKIPDFLDPPRVCFGEHLAFAMDALEERIPPRRVDVALGVA